MKYFLTVAASDTSGGAGIQQDIKTAHNLGFWALSAITGITSQNFLEVSDVKAIDPISVESQIVTSLSSFKVNAIKIGAICSSENILVIAECLKKYKCENVVLDPILKSTSEKELLPLSALDLLKEKLFPLVTLVTPNKSEFETLTGYRVDSIEDAIKIAQEFSKIWNISILVKGGHFEGSLIKEALITNSELFMFKRKRRMFAYSHGTGCTLSTAIACFLGKNFSLVDSCNKASQYLVKHYQWLQNKLNY